MTCSKGFLFTTARAGQVQVNGREMCVLSRVVWTEIGSEMVQKCSCGRPISEITTVHVD